MSEATDNEPFSPPRDRPGASGVARIWILIAGVSLVALAITWWVRDLPAIEAPFQLSWPVFIPLVFLGEAAVVSLQFRRDAHVFSMSEIPLVVGLFFTVPLGLIGAQLLGNVVALGVWRRQSARKLAFNLSLLTLQSVLAVIVFRFILGTNSPLGLYGSIGVLAAVGVGVVAANILINAAILISGGSLTSEERLSTFKLGVASASMNASLGLVAVTVMWTRPGTGWAAAVPPIALYLAYRAYVSQREERQRIQALYEATMALFRSPRVEDIMFAAVTHARSMFDVERAEIQVFSEEPKGQRFRTAVGPGDQPDVVLETVDADSAGEFLAEEMGLSGPLLLPCKTNGHGRRGRTSHHRMVVPVHGPDGINGSLVVSDPLGDVKSFAPSDLRFLETLASQVSVSLENGRLEDSLAQVTKLKDDLRHRALHDSLTELGNRALLWDALEALQVDDTENSESAVLMLDLDDFKTVNDTLGHHAGDLLLIEVARRLEAACRPEDTIARLGGDEFAVLLDRMSAPGDAEVVAARIARTLSRPVLISGQALTPQASIGIALVESGGDPKEWMRRADEAMYAAKRKGKGSYLVFEESAEARGFTVERELEAGKRKPLAGDFDRD